MKRSSRPRKTNNLSESIQRQLNMYAMEAGVAALSVLALRQPSEARIVYTPVHIQVDDPYNLDLNHDGISDFTLQQTHYRGNGCDGHYSATDNLLETPAHGNGAALANNFAAALGRGVEIGSNQSFGSSQERMADVYSIWLVRSHHCTNLHAEVGPWVNVSDHYLGLEFQIKGKTHHGWARLRVQVGYVYINATLTGYAYETIAGKSIIAGKTKGVAEKWEEDDFGPDASLTNPITDKQPASLGALAMGAPGLPIWRRKEEVEIVK